MFNPALLREIRARFHHVDSCPYQGARIFFENAGGSLRLKTAAAAAAKLSELPDNQGRDNPASRELARRIDLGRRDMLRFLGADSGKVFVGETGTECLFRVIRAAVLGAAAGGRVLGGTLEHPATRSAARRWAAHAGKEYTAIAHDPHTCELDAADYRRALSAGVRVATVIQTSPVAGVSVDVGAVAAAIREAAPDCFIIVDGIQHAPHGCVDIAALGIDAYAVSGYKVFSRHNYGFAWVSKRLANLPHDKLDGTPDDHWELGTRDTAAYAAFSEVAAYFDWLGAHFTEAGDRRAKLLAAGEAIAAHEKHLVEVMLHGGGGQKGLAAMPQVFIVAGADNPRREGLVSLAVRSMPSAQVVAALSERGVRVHIRKNDYFSANILDPLEMTDCVRVSMCHYNSA
ncbi:MAG: aminotransferase class V-fold PLP-dependent enzyme, partial [Gammaproteobacteria bacterium]